MDLQSMLSQVIRWHKDAQYEPIIRLVSFLNKNFMLFKGATPEY